VDLGLMAGGGAGKNRLLDGAPLHQKYSQLPAKPNNERRHTKQRAMPQHYKS